MSNNEKTSLQINRREVLLTGAAALLSSWSVNAVTHLETKPDFTVKLSNGVLNVSALSQQAFRIRFTPDDVTSMPTSSIMTVDIARPTPHRLNQQDNVRLTLQGIRCEWDHQAEQLSFFDRSGRLLLREAVDARRLTPSLLRDKPTLIVEQGFETPVDEYLFGTGCFQDGHLNLRALPRRLTQVNTQISLPFILSSRGYGLLWHNTGMSEFNVPERVIALQQVVANATTQVDNVTTTGGNAQVSRRTATFEGKFVVDRSGSHAFLLDIGRKMASQHYVEIDGKVYTDMSNLWLPPTTGFVADLTVGEHHIKVIADEKDLPSVSFGRFEDRMVWRSPVADAIDYVVIAGPSSAEVMSGYRELMGTTPLMPLWAYGYIHCRERFHSSEEILSTAHEFRQRKLPVDVMVQDWQYWGKYGWNAMQFDEEYYPDPAKLVRDLHSMNMRFMLSVWSKISRDTELGKECAAKNFYIPETDWVDFFNPKAAAFYWKNQKEKLAALGIDAWWQDATEPENDDLVGRDTAIGPGERERLTYPLQVTRTVYEGQRRDFPDRRVMILTRSAFVGQQRFGAATWSGDIGNNWETLKRQIPAGLNMAAAGYPYWTVDAGGFFRPGDGQYTDPKYHERFIRWFQYATFLPLQRVHGYMTQTEFWHYGEQVENVSRQYLELRYRLLPYIYSTAAEATRTGLPLMRPLVFDFADDKTALEQSHAYMFGGALHVAPVFEPGVTEWPVYLPETSGGWYDFWTGQHREGGTWYNVSAPLSQIPLHVRAGSILPLGSIIQSTAEALGQDISLHVFPGCNGSFDLYEDDGLTYSYEKRACSNIRMTWDDTHATLLIGRREGRFPAMRVARNFTIHCNDAESALTKSQPVATASYRGDPILTNCKR